MIARVLFVWIAFSIILLLLGLFSQGEPFEFSQVFLAFALSLPVAVSVLRGGLGDSSDGQLQYPSLSLMVISAWILMVAPSLIVESQEARYLYHYSDGALTLARLFFLGWCMLFVVGAGSSRLKELSARPTIIDFIACTAVALLIVTFLLRAGLFSNYQSSRTRILPVPGAGTTESIAVVLGTTLFTLMPPLLFLMLLKIQSRTSQAVFVFMAFLASWGLLFLLGSRTGVGVAIAGCLLLCRALGMRLRANVLIGLSVALPAALVLILVYRSALATSDSDTVTVSHLLSVASDATSALNDQDAQSDALDMVSSNARVRLWYGQQFCVLVDLWLDEGAALRGTLFSNVIAALPTFFASDKNALATELNFEIVMLGTHRFPDIDLAPMPWMQWLYELGLLGLVIGALLYAWLARTIERRVSKTRSFYEIMFWLGLFASMLPPEHTTDSLVLSARGGLVYAIVLGSIATALTWLSTLGRHERAA